MKPTEQDKRDIEETILWLNKGADWCVNMPPEFCEDDEPGYNERWLNSVVEANEVATKWLRRIQKGDIKDEDMD
jgi:hypothetical protein